MVVEVVVMGMAGTEEVHPQLWDTPVKEHFIKITSAIIIIITTELADVTGMVIKLVVCSFSSCCSPSPCNTACLFFT